MKNHYNYNLRGVIYGVSYHAPSDGVLFIVTTDMNPQTANRGYLCHILAVSGRDYVLPLTTVLESKIFTDGHTAGN